MSSSIRSLICGITLVIAAFGLPEMALAQISSSTCYTNNVGPGCDNAYCEAVVCEIDSSCCDSQWDSQCANQAITSCPGNCLTTEGHDAGCSGTACESTVCGSNSSCCNSDWDEACVDEALTTCGFPTFDVPGSELCWPLVATNGNVAVSCLGPDLLVPLDVNDPPANNPPVVEAGADQSIILPTQVVQLSGTVTDDGKPTPPSLSYLWALTSGDSNNVTIDSANSVATSVTITSSGVYTFELTADDGDRTGSDTLQVTVANPPADMIVNTVSVNNATPQTGQGFLLRATVRNQGGSASSANTTLRYRRSTDSTITNADTAMGIDGVPVLAPGGSSPESRTVSIGAAGTYWVGACVDAVSGESPTNNQCSVGVQVTVTNPPADLIVDSVAVTDSTPETGQPITFKATVRNQGGSSSSSSTTLRYFRSPDNVISIKDVQLGSDPISILSAGGSSAEDITGAIANAGTYWIGACVDEVGGESPTDNQCSVGVQVVVSDPATSADLIVNSASVSNATPSTGQSFTFSATVRNQGSSSSSGVTTLRYRRSTNSTITNSDTAIGTDSVPILAAGGSSPENIAVSISAAGTYWIGACVDAVAGESPTDNQCSAGVQVTVSAPVPADLYVNGVSVTDSTPNTGQSFTISATARNQGGSSSSGSTTLRYYRSTNSTITTGDTQLATDAVPILAAGGNSPESVSVSIASAGTYWVGACVDAVTGESPTDNQCSAGVQVTVSALVPADLYVNGVSVTDSTPNTGQSFTISATARNQGGSSSSGSTTLRYYRSTNSTITTGDTQLATDAVPILAAGGNSPESVSVSIASAGTYWVGACVDAVTGESPTDNQCSAGVQVTVSALVPADLYVNGVSVTDSTPNTGQSFTISATARNQGGSSSSGSTTLRYYRSTNSTISTGDTQLATDFVPILAAGGSSPESAVVSISSPGTFYVGACVDSVTGETPINNQCSAGVQVIVSCPAGQRNVGGTCLIIIIRTLGSAPILPTLTMTLVLLPAQVVIRMAESARFRQAMFTPSSEWRALGRQILSLSSRIVE